MNSVLNHLLTKHPLHHECPKDPKSAQEMLKQKIATVKYENVKHENEMIAMNKHKNIFAYRLEMYEI